MNFLPRDALFFIELAEGIKNSGKFEKKFGLLGGDNNLTPEIESILLQKRFPVEHKYNAKINRERI